MRDEKKVENKKNMCKDRKFIEFVEACVLKEEWEMYQAGVEYKFLLVEVCLCLFLLKHKELQKRSSFPCILIYFFNPLLLGKTKQENLHCLHRSLQIFYILIYGNFSLRKDMYGKEYS